MEISPDLMYRLLVQGVSDYAIYMLDRDGVVLNWNAGAERAKGYAAADIVGRNYALFYSADDQAAGLPARNLAIALRKGRLSAEGWRYRRDGTAFWASLTIDAIYDADGAFLCFAKITRDLSEQHALIARIEHQAKHDALTGLLNRAGLFERLSAELATECPAAIYCIDLDHFKPVNDRLGHAAGDMLLHEVARRLADLMNGAGFAGRLGGDEFVAVQTGLADSDRPDRFARRIVACFADPIRIAGEMVAVGASIGIARTTDHGRDLATLLGKADSALYRAKENGRNGVADADDAPVADARGQHWNAASRRLPTRAIA